MLIHHQAANSDNRLQQPRFHNSKKIWKMLGGVPDLQHIMNWSTYEYVEITVGLVLAPGQPHLELVSAWTCARFIVVFFLPC